jgi:cytidine diphosphoramidate kinase
MVLWFVGMSGSGKSLLSDLVYQTLKIKKENLVLLDGDILRDVFGGDADHTVSGRAKNARRLSHLSKLLADQNIHVIAAVLSIFPEWQKWNRENIPGYCQVYVNVPFNVLQRREIKGLYAGALAGEIKNVVGVDIDFPEPVGNDLILDNSEDREDFMPLVEQVLNLPGVKDCQE